MANYDVQYQLQVTDINGDTALCRVNQLLADTSTLAAIATSAAAVATALAATTNGKITSQGVSANFVKAQISAGTAPPPANATYPSVTDGAELNFGGSGTGVKRRFVIPAPLLTDFKTNSNIVNPADANVAPLIAQLESMNDEGATVNLYEGGIKVGKHSRKRRAIKSL